MSAAVIGFAGMTHLGVNSAAAAMARGFRVVCHDADARVIDDLAHGKPPVVEPGLDEILREKAASAEYSARAASLARCDLVYISTDVATDDAGASDLSRVHALIAAVGKAMRQDAILVVLCQVPPGFTRALELPKERLYYQVETLVFGRALERALNPERFIVGCAAPESPLPAAYAEFLAAFGCPVLPMRYESAELAKIAINCCLVASVSVANTLAEICERTGAAWSEIAPALKLDRRIGPHAYLSPGLGIAGGNLERDLATVIRIAGEQGTDAGVVEAWLANSRHRRDWAVRTVQEALLDRNPEATLAIWGLAYKENTHSVKNSPSLATIAQLPHATLRLHDPVVPAAQANHPHASGAADPIEAARGADALMILTPWPEYRKIAPAQIAAALRGRIVLDPYAVLDAKAAVAAGLELHTLGRAVQGAGHAAEHLLAQPQKPARAVIVGASGFVGSAVASRLERDGVPVLRIGRRDVDLLAPGARERLARMLRPDDAFVAVAARAPCKNADMLVENMVMARAMAGALADAPVAHVVNISSDAVYADSAAPLTEDSCAAPATLHGAMHLAREVMLQSDARAPLAILRPSLLYGASDPHNGYGPNRFRRLAAKGEDIVLFGEGEERRDHVYIDDVAELAARVLYRRSRGVLNVATGEVHSFRVIAEKVVAISGRSVAIRGSPRSGPMPHNGYRPFDIASSRAAFPDFAYTSLDEGLARAWQARGG